MFEHSVVALHAEQQPDGDRRAAQGDDGEGQESARPRPVAGLLGATPWVLLAALAAALVIATLRHARRSPDELAGPTADPARARARLWCGAALLTLGTVTGLPEITEFFASMRFLGDVAGGLVLAGA
ncbi:MAG TPA: hypothetical protein VKQ32_26385, partial [Polyangia bacterium]|nr:hypothetical protein [Polyangia bacterium]